MAVVVEIDLMTGRYEAAGAGDRDAAEWPPHPARVFCALLAGARAEDERDALRWLERQAPPVVRASQSVQTSSRTGYVVTNARPRAGKGGSQFHLARTNAERSRVATVPSTAAVTLVWSDAEASAETVAVLDRLARRVPYLGRSTGVAALRATSAQQQQSPAAGQVEYLPVAGGSAGSSIQLRVPYDGYLDTLEDLFDAGRPAWEDSRTVRYRRADTGTEACEGVAATTPMPSVYTDLVVLRFRGIKPDGRLTVRLTTALRRALMKATEDPLPAALHGHGADDRPHVAFLALPNVGNEHADGRLLGMAVALPDLPVEERTQILAGLLHGLRRPDAEDERVLALQVPGLGEVELEYSPGLVKPWGARPDRWRAGSTRWATATPVVLDRYPKRGDVESAIRATCARLGLPGIEEIDVRTVPILPGGVSLRPQDLPEKARGRLYRHVDLVFERPVAGPLLLGAGRYFGVGLFAPVPPQVTVAADAGVGGEPAVVSESDVEGAA